MVIDYEGGFVILKNIVKLYTNFCIFPNNHLINEREANFSENNNLIGENYILKSHFNIDLYNRIQKFG